MIGVPQGSLFGPIFFMICANNANNTLWSFLLSHQLAHWINTNTKKNQSRYWNAVNIIFGNKASFFTMSLLEPKTMRQMTPFNWRVIRRIHRPWPWSKSSGNFRCPPYDAQFNYAIKSTSITRSCCQRLSINSRAVSFVCFLQFMVPDIGTAALCGVLYYPSLVFALGLIMVA